MVVDVERFGDPSRTNLDQLAVRDGLYDALRQVFWQSRVDWEGCHPDTQATDRNLKQLLLSSTADTAPAKPNGEP